MQRTARELVEHILKLRSDGHAADLADLYSSDAIIVRRSGAARGTEEIRSFLDEFLKAHERFELIAIESLNACDDVIVFDAMVETTVGLLQVAEVIVIDDNGLIRRHVPGLRGYWGR